MNAKEISTKSHHFTNKELKKCRCEECEKEAFKRLGTPKGAEK